MTRPRNTPARILAASGDERSTLKLTPVAERQERQDQIGAPRRHRLLDAIGGGQKPLARSRQVAARPVPERLALRLPLACFSAFSSASSAVAACARRGLAAGCRPRRQEPRQDHALPGRREHPTREAKSIVRC